MKRLKLPSGRTLRGWSFALALICLEAVPAQAWLVVYAAAQLHNLQATAAPFWLVCVVIALFAVARRRLDHYGAAPRLGSWVFCAIVSIFALARFSPLMYGDPRYPLNSLAWFDALFSGRFSPSALIGLILLVAYLGWRGNAAGATYLQYSAVARRFWLALAATILAIFGSLASSLSYDVVSAELMLLLALLGIAGLTALALARPESGSLGNDVRMPGAEISVRWQVLSALLAIAIVALALFIGGSLNLGSLQQAFGWLGPVGHILNSLAYWLIQGLAYLLYLLWEPLLSLIFGNHKLPNQQVNTPHGVSAPNKSSPKIPAVYGNTAALVIVALVIVATGLLLFVIARAIAIARDKSASEEVDEERELLDAQSLIAQRARELLDRWRRRRSAPERDDLQHGGARWLYREVMRAGARAGFQRAPSETADEYAGRLAGALRAGELDDADLLALARAYDGARYGENGEGDPLATVELTTQGREALQRVRELAREPKR
jgi:hypothetical protein